MKRNQWVVGLLIAAATASASAQPGGSGNNTVIGKVDTVYVRESKWLYIEKKLVRKVENEDLWVDVRFANPFPGDLGSELFQLPAHTAIERGDLVATKLGDQTALDMKLLPEVNQVTQLVAKHDTLIAMTFGLSNSRSKAGLWTRPQISALPAYPALADSNNP